MIKKDQINKLIKNINYHSLKAKKLQQELNNIYELPNINKKYILNIIKFNKISKKEFALKLDVSITRLSNWIGSNPRGVPINVIEKIVKIWHKPT